MAGPICRAVIMVVYGMRKSMSNPKNLDSLPALSLIDMPRIRPVLGKISDKWAVMILTVLCSEPARFNEIKRRLEGITHKALADALKRLERNGLVTRTVLATAPVAVEYRITPLGLSLREPFEALCRWALMHGAELERATGRYDAAKASQAT